MNEITEWILAAFVGGYIAGLISGIFIFIKIHYRIRPRGVKEFALTQKDAPKALPVGLLHRSGAEAVPAARTTALGDPGSSEATPAGQT